MRLGVVQEVGVDAQAVVVLNFNALQVQRGQPRRDLEVGLGMVDDRASEMEPGIRQLIAGTNHRNNLPWFPTRRWSGPPRELADDILARELVGLPEGTPPPPDFADRVRARYEALGRAGAGYLAHLALLRAERRDDHLLPWLNLATELVDLAPVQMGSGRHGDGLDPRAPGPDPAAAGAASAGVGAAADPVRPAAGAPQAPLVRRLVVDTTTMVV